MVIIVPGRMVTNRSICSSHSQIDRLKHASRKQIRQKGTKKMVTATTRNTTTKTKSRKKVKKQKKGEKVVREEIACIVAHEFSVCAEFCDVYFSAMKRCP